jgi:hypothetical protein
LKGKSEAIQREKIKTMFAAFNSLIMPVAKSVFHHVFLGKASLFTDLLYSTGNSLEQTLIFPIHSHKDEVSTARLIFTTMYKSRPGV